MTEADEQRAIDDEVQKFNKKIQELNKKHKFIQVTGLKLGINHPALVKSKPWFLRLFEKK